MALTAAAQGTTGDPAREHEGRVAAVERHEVRVVAEVEGQIPILRRQHGSSTRSHLSDTSRISCVFVHFWPLPFAMGLKRGIANGAFVYGGYRVI